MSSIDDPARVLSTPESDFFSRLSRLVVTYSAAESPRRVAVVGNQPLEPSEQRARMIDQADLVFRVNGFRVDDDTPTVGRRTDVVVFNRAVRPTPWFFERYTERVYLMVEPGRMHWEHPRLPGWWPRDLGALTMPNREVILPLNSAMGVDSLREARWATTGTTMVWIANRLFPDLTLDVTGFSFVDSPDQQAWNHAFGAPSPVGGEHRIDLEGQLLSDWIADGRIRFHR